MAPREDRRWEYKFERVVVSAAGAKALTEFSADGWRVLHVLPIAGESGAVQALLERELIPPGPRRS